MNHYQWVKDEINKLLMTKVVIQGSQSSWSAPFIIIPKGDGGKHRVTGYCTLNKVTQEIYLAHAKSTRYFSQLNGAKYFSMLYL